MDQTNDGKKKRRITKWHMSAAVLIVLVLGVAIAFGMTAEEKDSIAELAKKWTPVEAHIFAEKLSETKNENPHYRKDARRVAYSYSRSRNNDWTTLTGGGKSGLFLEEVQRKDGSTYPRERRADLKLVHKAGGINAHATYDPSLREHAVNAAHIFYAKVLK